MGEQVDDEIDQDAYVAVELKINESVVNVKRKRLILKSEKERLDSNNEMSDSKKVERSRSRSISARDSKDRKKDKKKKLKWLIPGILVRMISKKAADGKLYNKKLRITDVLD